MNAKPAPLTRPTLLKPITTSSASVKPKHHSLRGPSQLVWVIFAVVFGLWAALATA